MIVFTATDSITNNVYVGSARDSVEEQWARLIVMAEEGSPGELQEAIRVSGAANFQVETYDYADTPTEARELVRDASESLGATVIRTGRIQPTKPVQANRVLEKKEAEDEADATPVRSAEDLKNDVEAFLAAKKLKEENAQADTAPKTSVTSDVPSREALIKSASAQIKLSGRKESSRERSGTLSSSSSVSEKRSQQKEHGPVTQVDISAYLAEQAKKKVDSDQIKPDIALRKKESTQEAEDMKAVMMRIEMKRRQNRTSVSATKTKKKPTAAEVKQATEGLMKIAGSAANTASSKTVSSKVKKDKLPDGRVSSSSKEKRIKEAIAQERMEREAAQAAKVAAEAKEMAELMARLDQKTKEKERIRRRR